MARISLDPPRSLLYRIGARWSRRRYGAVLDPARAMAHHPGVLAADVGFELAVERWDRVDGDLKALAVLASAATIGCSWCVDFGSWTSAAAGLDPAKLRDLPRWRESEEFTALERRVLAYAEGLTMTPPSVTDEMVAELRRDLDDAQLVELTMLVAVENQRSRFNSGLGLTSQGFCSVPASVPATSTGR